MSSVIIHWIILYMYIHVHVNVMEFTWTCIYNVGVLAGMRPCGIIVLLAELFTSESKSQVYGCLCNYYACHPNAAQNIGVVVIHAR